MFAPIGGVLLCWLAAAEPAAKNFRAGQGSWEYRLDVGKDERRGPAVIESPRQLKQKIKPLLDRLRQGGLKPASEHNLDSFFAVADAFEADGRLATARDVLLNLQENLHALEAARAGKPTPGSLVASEDDLLPYRDAHNIHAVTAHYYSGGQPSAAGYRWLKAKGVTTVINLRESADHEKALVEGLGMRYVHVSWPDLQPPSLEQVRKIVATVETERKRGGKVFQHCLRGIGRDGTMVCCVRVAGGLSAEKAIAEWLKAAPTWLEDQARDKDDKPVQIQTVKEFEQMLKKK